MLGIFSDFSAARFARKTGLTRFAGADSHRELSLAPCYQIMPDFGGPAEFLTALRSATLVTGRHSLDYFARMSAQLLRHLICQSFAGRVGNNAPASAA